MIRIAGYLMDLALTEEHNFPGEATQFPIESGADMTDHIRDLPEEITLESIVSDTPIGAVAADSSRQADGINAPLPSTDAYQKLREIKAARRPVTIETSLGTFESMAFIDLSIPKDAAKSGGLFFTAQFQKANIVTNKRTRVRVATPLAGAGGKAKPKAATLSPIQVDRIIDWRKGVPPGAALRPGFLTIKVTVGRRTRPEGYTHDELQAISASDPNASSGRESLVDYFETHNDRPILGQERKDLIADLRRDANDRRDADAREMQALIARDPVGQRKKALNLAPGIDLDAFNRPPQPTLPPGVR